MNDAMLCIVEIPKGSRNKYEWDDERPLILLERFHFFVAYKQREKPDVKARGWASREQAEDVVRDAQERYRDAPASAS